MIHCANGLWRLLIRSEVQTSTILGLWSGPIYVSAKDSFKEASTYSQAIADCSCPVLCCKCALLTPTSSILRDRWIRMLPEISAKKWQPFTLLTFLTRQHFWRIFKPRPLKRGIRMERKHCCNPGHCTKYWLLCRCGAYPPSLFSSPNQII